MLLNSDLVHTDAYAATGTSLCLAANRLSFAFGLQGPSVALDTACSSSLVALHLACQSIRNGECDAALAGGVSMMLSPVASVNLTKAGFCAPDGRVRAFDAAANGYVRSEGAGLVVLKPLSAALKDEDPIYAVIRGSAVNQNGTSNGLTAPSRAAQEQVLREAYARAKVSPGQVQFVETQGTGTRLGDAIEAMALGNVLREGRPPDSRCAIGSVKTNIGHTEAASGIASLMKVALALKHRQLPPNLHFRHAQSRHSLRQLAAAGAADAGTLAGNDATAMAGVSAFGFGGSNSHVVLEEPPPANQAAAQPAPDGPADAAPCRFGLPLLLSARTEKALRDLAERYAAFLRNDPPAWQTCATRRPRAANTMIAAWRCWPSRTSRPSSLLESFSHGDSPAGVLTGRKPTAAGRQSHSCSATRRRAVSLPPRVCSMPSPVSPRCGRSRCRLSAGCRPVAGNPAGRCGRRRSCAGPLRPGGPATCTDQVVAPPGHCPRPGPGPGHGRVCRGRRGGHSYRRGGLATGRRRPGRQWRLTHDGLQPRPASLPFLSSVDGELHAGPDLDAAHWQACLRRPAGRGRGSCGPGRPEDRPLPGIAQGDRHRFRPTMLRTAAAMGTAPRATSTCGRRWPPSTPPAPIFPGSGWHSIPGSVSDCPRIPGNGSGSGRTCKNRFLAEPGGGDRPHAQASAAGPAAAAAVRVRPDLTAPYVAPRDAVGKGNGGIVVGHPSHRRHRRPRQLLRTRRRFAASDHPVESLGGAFG